VKEILRIPVRVRDISERFAKTNWRKDASGNTSFDTTSLGWYVWFEGSFESNFVGPTKPQGLEVGDTVWFILAKGGKS